MWDLQPITALHPTPLVEPITPNEANSAPAASPLPAADPYSQESSAAPSSRRAEPLQPSARRAMLLLEGTEGLAGLAWSPLPCSCCCFLGPRVHGPAFPGASSQSPYSRACGHPGSSVPWSSPLLR